MLSYLRRYKEDTVLVVLNMSGSPQKASFDLGAQGIFFSKAKALLRRLGLNQPVWRSVSLDPFGVYIGEVTK